MKKKLCVLLTTAMLATTMGIAVAAPDETATPAEDPTITATEPSTNNDAAADTDATTDADATADADTATDEQTPAEEPVPVQEQPIIAVTVDGQTVTMDQPPVIQDGRTLVPLRAIFEALGAEVEWNADTQSVFADKRLDTISLTIGENKLFINGEETALDVPAQIIEGRTMVPARAISEALGAKVEWNADIHQVTIVSNQSTHAMSDKYLTSQGKSADGSTVLYTISAAYPVLANPDGSSIIAAINTAMEKAAQDYVASTEATVAELDIDPAVVPTPYTFDLRFDVTYDQNGLLSFCSRAVEDTKGAHPNTIMTGTTFDTTLGTQLTLTDVLKATQEDVNKQVIDGFTALIDAAKEGTYFGEAKDTLAKEVGNAEFYLTNDGVVVYFQLYTLQPYAAGFSTCTLAFPQAAQ